MPCDTSAENMSMLLQGTAGRAPATLTDSGLNGRQHLSRQQSRGLLSHRGPGEAVANYKIPPDQQAILTLQRVAGARVLEAANLIELYKSFCYHGDENRVWRYRSKANGEKPDVGHHP